MQSEDETVLPDREWTSTTKRYARAIIPMHHDIAQTMTIRKASPQLSTAPVIPKNRWWTQIFSTDAECCMPGQFDIHLLCSPYPLVST